MRVWVDGRGAGGGSAVEMQTEVAAEDRSEEGREGLGRGSLGSAEGALRAAQGGRD